MNRRDAIAALMSLPATARISKAQVKSTDVIVIECDHQLSQQVIASIEHAAKSCWPENKVAVLCGGLRLRIAEHV